MNVLHGFYHINIPLVNVSILLFSLRTTPPLIKVTSCRTPTLSQKMSIQRCHSKKKRSTKMFGSCNFPWHIWKESAQKFIHNPPVLYYLQPGEIKDKCLEWRHVFLFSGLRIESQFDLWENVRTAFQRHLGMRTSSNLGTSRSHLNSVDTQRWWEFCWSKVLFAPWPQPNHALWEACLFSWRFSFGVQLQFYFHCHLKCVILWESF